MFPKSLADGYRLWRDEKLPHEKGRLAQLAALGQAPQALIIGCCDSRVSPETIFSSGPGELFVLRNVASVIPPFSPDGRHHGTSAAVEFAVSGLAVPHIVVIGHSQCGGIRAHLSEDTDTAGLFIGPWMDLIKGAKEEALAKDGKLKGRALETAVEEEGVRVSIKNLRTFPFVRDIEDKGRMDLHGCHFDIATGTLSVLNHSRGEFFPL
jgi:carbonic anhydrase